MKSVLSFALDVLAIALFALLARMAHQSEEMPFTFAGWLETTWPFLAGVVLSYLRLILLRGGVASRIWPEGVTIWVVTALVGLGIWGLNNREVPHWSFIIVATVMSGLLLLGWRVIAVALTRRRARQVS